LECESLLSEEPERYEAPLDEISRQLVALLAPQSLHPQDTGNQLLALERAFEDGVAELERAGHPTVGMSVFVFLHRLQALEKKEAK
jgi:hypothetical protein